MPQEPVDTLIHPRWIATLDPDDRILEEHSLAIRQGRILTLLPQREAAARYRPGEEVDLPGHLLIPGLVNLHTHAAMTLMRGLADDLPLMTWLQEHIWPTEARHMSEAFVQDGTRLALLEMLRGGTTCFNDMYFFPDETARVTAAAGMRTCVGLILIDFPSAWAQDAEEYLHKGLEVCDQFRGHPLIRTAFAPHAPYTVSARHLQRMLTYAEELDLQIHMHLHETRDEVMGSLREHGQRPLARMDALGLLSPRLIAVHMTQLEPDERERLTRTGVHVAHCPQSNLKLASGFCPLADLERRGLNLGIGTDGAASNNDLDLLDEGRSAALLAKAVAGEAAAVSAHRMLRMLTLDGARALGLDGEIGSIEPGKAADLVAVDLSAPETQPLYDPISQLIYAAGREQIRHVWIAGRRLLADRRPLTLDAEAILARAGEWQTRIGTAARG